MSYVTCQQWSTTVSCVMCRTMATRGSTGLRSQVVHGLDLFCQPNGWELSGSCVLQSSFGLWYSSQPGYCMWGMLVFKLVFGLIRDPTTTSCVTCQKWSTTVSCVMCHVPNKSTTRIPGYMCPAPTSVFVCILDGYCILTRRLLRQLSQTAIMSVNSPDKEE